MSGRQLRAHVVTEDFRPLATSYPVFRRLSGSLATLEFLAVALHIHKLALLFASGLFVALGEVFRNRILRLSAVFHRAFARCLPVFVAIAF